MNSAPFSVNLASPKTTHQAQLRVYVRDAFLSRVVSDRPS